MRLPRSVRVLVAVAPLLGLAPLPSPAQDWEAVEIRTLGVRPGLFMLTGRGGNLAVSVGADGAFLVDDQFAPLSAKILAAVAALGANEVRFVLNTHWHGDHTGGNENLGRAGALIVAHDNVRRRLAVEQRREGRPAVPPAPAQALPVVTFGADVTFHWNAQEIHVVHVPGAHTDGDAIVHFRGANVLHLGDVFFNGMYPFIDLDSGGSLQGVLAAVERALGLCDADTRIIPGHGPLATRADLVAYQRMLGTLRERVQAAIDRGDDLDAVLAARPGAEFDAAWGRGFIGPEAMLRSVYRSLRR